MVKLVENFYTLRCIVCNKEYEEKDTCTFCLDCKEPLDVIYDYDFIRQRLNVYALKNSPISALKYLTFYPIINLEKIVSLNEGGTPLHHCRNLSKKYGVKNLYIKNEGANPTGVFKDRGTLVEVTKALEMGAKAVCLASTGNMAASVAAYCSIAKIPCYVLVPEDTPIGKLAQTLSYGARIVKVRGTYSDCARLAVKMSEKHGFYLAGDYVFRLEGQKSQAYEIAEQLGWKAPDYLICPVGCGTNLAAIWKGFVELKKINLIDSLPKLIAVQPNGCNVVVKAFNLKKKMVPLDKPSTICGAVCAGYPLDGLKVLKALKESHGYAVELSDDDALMEEQVMAKEEAMFVEPSGALPMAAVNYLSRKKFFKANDVVVCIATGNGLKDPKSAVKILPDPPTINPEMSEIDNYLHYKLYHIQSEGMKNKHNKLWGRTPDLKSLKDIINKEFSVKPEKEVLQKILVDIKGFEMKGKKISKQDLQNILEDELDANNTGDKFLEILDFQTTTSLTNPAAAKIKIRYGDLFLDADSDGVGTVDAIISALRKGIESHDKLEVRLTDYNVEIFTGGVDATVKVTLTAVDKRENKIIAESTSPDVIVASVRAFEKAYNFLHNKS